MAQSIIQVDAFTSEPYKGNPAAVCVLPAPAEDDWMRAVAREMNLSETAFLYAEGDGYRLRWFTPAAEVDLCGHATLASAHVLWTEGHLATDEIVHFATRSGMLTAQQQGERIVMDFPATPPQAIEVPPDIAAVLGAAPVRAGQSRFDGLFELESPAALRALQPDIARIAQLKLRGVIVTSVSDTVGVDFLSRYFAPAVGVPEDPVTGSAHCALAPYWAERLGKSTMVGYQASARGGTVYVELAGERVRLGGHAVTVVRGSLVV